MVQEKEMHPAVKCHYDDITVHNGPSEPTDFVPNFAEITPYLAQLPSDQKYMVVDPEASIPDSLREEADSWEKVGLEVKWDDDNRGYGGMYMVKKGERVGVYIYVNGCSLASAPGYWVLPV